MNHIGNKNIMECHALTIFILYFFKESPNNNIPSHPFKLKSDFTPPLPDNENLLEFISLVYQEIYTRTQIPLLTYIKTIQENKYLH